jgi:probable HAF family extracellular repeat protein
MNSLSKHHRLVSAFRAFVLVACLALAVSTTVARTTYILTDLGVLPNKKASIPAALNNQGQVTGISSTGDPSGDAAFRYDGGSNRELENLGSQLAGSASRGLGINDFGVVVGDSTYFGRSEITRHATLFSNGSTIDLGTLQKAGSFSRANGINSVGQVVGSVGPELDGERTRAFIWNRSTGMLDLGTLGGSYAQASAINDAGFVTGSSQTINNRLAGAVHAFLYSSLARAAVSPMRDLGTLGGNFSYGMSINSKSHVAGYSTLDNNDNRVHAFLFDGARMRDLGSLVGQGPQMGGPGAIDDQSVALGINANDQVVGYSYIPAQGTRLVRTPTQGQQVAFVYSQGVMEDLNTLIEPDAATRYILYSATAINDRGDIVATALSTKTGNFRAVLLTPIVNSR